MGKEIYRLVFYRVKSLFPIKIQNLCGQKVFVAGKAVDTNSWRSDGAKHSIVASSDSCPIRFWWNSQFRKFFPGGWMEVTAGGLWLALVFC